MIIRSVTSIASRIWPNLPGRGWKKGHGAAMVVTTGWRSATEKVRAMLVFVTKASNNADIYKDKYPHIPKRTAFGVTDIKGSSFNYAYHCTGTTAATDTRSSIVKHKFIQCYCERCRSRDYDHCPSRPEFGEHPCIPTLIRLNFVCAFEPVN